MKSSASAVKSMFRRLAMTSVAVLGMNGAQAAGELNVYNWSDYIGPDHVVDFTKKFSIQTRYDNFDSNESLHAKMVAGGTGYDIVVPTHVFAKMQLDGGLLQPINKSKIPNLKNLDPALMKTLATIDPDNKYFVPWAWGYTTLGINVGKVTKALGGMPLPDNEWDLLFKPEYVSKLKSCGVSVLDAGSEVVPAALHYLGKSVDSRIQSDYEEAGKLLASIRPSITVFSSSGYINELANGSICLSLGWSGDLGIASRRAKEVKNGHDIKVLVPKKGGIIFYDVMAIPKDAKNVDNAHQWINYYLEPEVSASMTNEVTYANPNIASLKFVDESIASDKAVFVTAENMANMKTLQSLTNDQRRLQTRTFTRFKSGR